METQLSKPKTRRESEVWQACDDLWAKSSSMRNLTGDNIRDQLLALGYKRGSPNEIYRYRNSWRDSRGILDADASGKEDIQSSDPISRAVSLVYDQMRSQASDAIDQLKNDYEKKLGEKIEEIEALNYKCASLDTDNQFQLKTISEATDSINSLTAENDELRKNAFIYSERLKNAEDKIEAIAKEQQALIFELKQFHDKEIDIWREKHKELNDALVQKGAQFSEELMNLKTMLRQAIEEKETAKAKALSLEEALKESRLLQQNWFESLQVQLQGFKKDIQTKSHNKERQLSTLVRELLAVKKKRKPRR